MKDEALDRNVWTTQLGRGYRRVVRENTERVNPEGTLVACYWTVFFLGLATNIAEGFFFACVLRDCQQLVPTSSK